MNRRRLFPRLATLAATPALLCRAAAERAPETKPRSEPRIDRVTIHHGNMDPEDPNSWLLNVVAVEAGGATGRGEAATTYDKASTCIPEVFPYRPEDWCGPLKNPYEKRIENGHIPVGNEPALGVEADPAWLGARLARIVVGGR